MLVITNIVSELAKNLKYMQKSSLLPFLKYPIEVHIQPKKYDSYFKANQNYLEGHWKIYFLAATLMSIVSACKVLTDQNSLFVYKVFGYTNVYLIAGICYHLYFEYKNAHNLCCIYNEVISFENRYENCANQQLQFWNPKNNSKVWFAKYCIQNLRSNYLAIPIFLAFLAIVFPNAPWSLIPNFIAEWKPDSTGISSSVINIIFRFFEALYTYYTWKLACVTADLASTFCLTIAHYSIFAVGVAVKR